MANFVMICAMGIVAVLGAGPAMATNLWTMTAEGTVIGTGGQNQTTGKTFDVGTYFTDRGIEVDDAVTVVFEFDADIAPSSLTADSANYDAITGISIEVGDYSYAATLTPASSYSMTDGTFNRFSVAGFSDDVVASLSGSTRDDSFITDLAGSLLNLDLNVFSNPRGGVQFFEPSGDGDTLLYYASTSYSALSFAQGALDIPDAQTPAVPLPAPALLLGAGLAALAGLKRRRRA